VPRSVGKWLETDPGAEVMPMKAKTKAKTKAKVKAKANPKATGAESPSRKIDARIRELGDWRGETLARLRALIKEADPEVVEEWKWMGVPVFEDHGIICTGETYKSV